MGKYSYYDAKEGVIFTDLTGLTSNRRTVDEVVDELLAVIRSVPKKVYLVACWKDVALDKDTAEYYGQRATEVAKQILGTVRYDTTDVVTRIALRAETVKHSLQRGKANIFPSKEAALEAIRSGKV
jgi:hypothetical protein